MYRKSSKSSLLLRYFGVVRIELLPPSPSSRLVSPIMPRFRSEKEPQEQEASAASTTGGNASVVIDREKVCVQNKSGTLMIQMLMLLSFLRCVLRFSASSTMWMVLSTGQHVNVQWNLNMHLNAT